MVENVSVESLMLEKRIVDRHRVGMKATKDKAPRPTETGIGTRAVERTCFYFSWKLKLLFMCGRKVLMKADFK